MRVIKNESMRVRLKIWDQGVEMTDNTIEQMSKICELPFVLDHAALMPDGHLGIGGSVGSVVATMGAICPAISGVDLGCFTGETTVPMLDGTHRTLKEMSMKSEPFFIWAINPENKIVAAEATCQLTRKNAALVKITLDNKSEIRCTPDHKIMLRSGQYKEAKDLNKYEPLMPFYSQNDNGYTSIYQPYSKSYQRAHWIVARSGLMGTIPSFPDQTTIIHHKNFTGSNNTPQNLMFMGNKDHSSYHRSLVERNTHWQSPDFEEKRIAAIRARAKTPEGYKSMSEVGILNINKYMDENPEHFKNAVANNGNRGKEYLKSYNKSEKGRNKSKEVAAKIYTCPKCGTNGKSGFFFPNHINKCQNLAPNNHKVINVEFLTEMEDVYCLKVPIYHNFALSAGVFVHNCGMVAVRTTLTADDLPDNTHAIRMAIEAAVPVGRGRHESKNMPRSARFNGIIMEGRVRNLTERYPEVQHDQWMNQLGSLGSGNHFIELCLDEGTPCTWHPPGLDPAYCPTCGGDGHCVPNVWIMLHSGSRGIGNKIGSFFIDLAKKDMEKYFINLPDKDLAFFPEHSEHFDDYMEAVSVAQDYAKINREVMLEEIVKAMKESNQLPPFWLAEEAINCHHNYIARESHYGKNVFVTRKGAVRARKSDLVIIPGSMSSGSYIARGKENRESFHSCSHGAGRKMSRTEARKTFTLEDHIKSMEGVEGRTDEGVIDETKGAYKEIAAVMAAQADLVEVVHHLKQFLVVKG
jgi:tRNA-splicing ligase RtcB